MGFTIKRMLAGVLSAALLFGTAGERLHAAAAEAGNQASAAPSIQAPENLNEQGYDVVFAIDDSGSVRRQQEERNQAFRNIASLASGSDVRIGVVYFTDQVSDVLALTSVEDQEGSETVKSALNNTETLTYGTVEEAIAAGRTRICSFCANKDAITDLPTEEPME